MTYYSKTRRTLLKASLGAAATLGLPGLVPTSAAQSAARQTLGGGLTLVDAGGANVLAFDAGDGLLLVDSGPQAHAGALLDTLNNLHDGGVRTLFNTHWHAEQCGANEVLGSAGARIVAHAKTRQRLSTDYYLPHEERYQRALPEAAWPAETFHLSGAMEAAGERIEYGHLVEAHTDGDIYVLFREANVLAAGDAVSPLRDPELDWYGGGWLGGRVDALDLLLDITDQDTRIVPAFGPVIGRAELQAERDMTQELYNRVLDLVREGCSAECMLQEGALEGLGRSWNDPHKFLYTAYKGMWAHHNNLAPNIL